MAAAQLAAAAGSGRKEAGRRGPRPAAAAVRRAPWRARGRRAGRPPPLPRLAPRLARGASSRPADRGTLGMGRPGGRDWRQSAGPPDLCGRRDQGGANTVTGCALSRWRRPGGRAPRSRRHAAAAAQRRRPARRHPLRHTMAARGGNPLPLASRPAAPGLNLPARLPARALACSYSLCAAPAPTAGRRFGSGAARRPGGAAAAGPLGRRRGHVASNFG
jgi:hypothetical protein